MYDTSQIKKILRKKLDGTINVEEELLLKEWGEQNTFNAELLNKITNKDLLLEDLLSWFALKKGEEQISWTERLENKILSKIDTKNKISRMAKKPTYRNLLPYVAALLITSVFGLIYFQSSLFKEDARLVNDLCPGTNRASITLADGREIALSEGQNEIVLGNELSYADGTLISALDEGAITYAELRTPRGGQYKITLSDGTKVWLNADSKLKYPSRFEGDVRSVTLEGEAYFEVVSSTDGQKKRPFLVKTATQEVEVLGTVFNVMAYADTKDVATTLVEGSVKIATANETILLRPGEQGITDGDNINRRKVDIEQYLAWKNNEIIFFETELKDAMRMLSRWYNFDVVYEEPIPLTHFYGTINRDRGLAEVLKIMDISGLKFRIQQHNGENKLFVLK